MSSVPGSGAFSLQDSGWIFSGSRIFYLTMTKRLSLCSWNHNKQEKRKFVSPYFSCTVESGMNKNFLIRDEKCSEPGKHIPDPQHCLIIIFCQMSNVDNFCFRRHFAGQIRRRRQSYWLPLQVKYFLFIAKLFRQLPTSKRWQDRNGFDRR
jgi:hypothetical protein